MQKNKEEEKEENEEEEESGTKSNNNTIIIFVIIGIIIVTIIVIIIYFYVLGSDQTTSEDNTPACDAGLYYNPEYDNCYGCPINTYSTAGLNECLPCPAGQYTYGQVGQTTCYTDLHKNLIYQGFKIKIKNKSNQYWKYTKPSSVMLGVASEAVILTTFNGPGVFYKNYDRIILFIDDTKTNAIMTLDPKITNDPSIFITIGKFVNNDIRFTWYFSKQSDGSYVIYNNIEKNMLSYTNPDPIDPNNTTNVYCVNKFGDTGLNLSKITKGFWSVEFVI